MRNRSLWLQTAAVCVLVAFLAACAKDKQQATSANSQAAPAGSPAVPATSSSGPPAAASQGAASPQSGAPPAAAPAAPAPVQTATYTLPAGTVLHIRLNGALDSGETDPGTRFSGTLSRPLRLNGVEVARAGSAISGKVTNAISSGRLSRPAELSLTLTSLTPTGGSPMSIRTYTLSMKGQSHKGRDAKIIGGTAGLGALIGGIAGHGHGAAIGALAGGGVGTAGAAATGKQEIHLAAETVLTFRLSQPASFALTPSQ
jgi:hypothetical protein